jgi:hypothetical protein
VSRRAARVVVQVSAFVLGAEDSHGNAREEWTAPVDALVYGIAPRTSDEPIQPGRDAVVVTHEVYAPFGFSLGPRDRVRHNGVLFEVEGPRQDWVNGPYSGRQVGSVFGLRHVEG